MPTISECRKELKKLKEKDVCIDLIKEVLNDCLHLSFILHKLRGYSRQCLSPKDIELREATKAKIDNININTEKDQLDAIKKSSDHFDLTRELFNKRYEAVQEQINVAIVTSWGRGYMFVSEPTYDNLTEKPLGAAAH